jgi:hypothetical protein
MPDYWYRYEDRRYAGGCDESGDPIPGAAHSEIILRTFQVLSTTPQGVWLSLGGDKRRWVSYSAHKRFACSTKELALRSFIARKQKQRAIYAARMRIAEELIGKARRQIINDDGLILSPDSWSFT